MKIEPLDPSNAVSSITQSSVSVTQSNKNRWLVLVIFSLVLIALVLWAWRMRPLDTASADALSAECVAPVQDSIANPLGGLAAGEAGVNLQLNLKAEDLFQPTRLPEGQNTLCVLPTP